jgi:hypothetical protein
LLADENSSDECRTRYRQNQCRCSFHFVRPAGIVFREQPRIKDRPTECAIVPASSPSSGPVHGGVSFGPATQADSREDVRIFVEN